jgi:hypothetical protein
MEVREMTDWIVVWEGFTMWVQIVIDAYILCSVIHFLSRDYPLECNTSSDEGENPEEAADSHLEIRNQMKISNNSECQWTFENGTVKL